MKKYGNIALLFLALVVIASSASAQVTLTEMVAMDDYVTALVTAVGGLMAAIVGGYCAFIVVKKGMRWLNKIG
jgi:hypothetical protein